MCYFAFVLQKGPTSLFSYVKFVITTCHSSNNFSPPDTFMYHVGLLMPFCAPYTITAKHTSCYLAICYGNFFIQSSHSGLFPSRTVPFSRTGPSGFETLFDSSYATQNLIKLHRLRSYAWNKSKNQTKKNILPKVRAWDNRRLHVRWTGTNPHEYDSYLYVRNTSHTYFWGQKHYFLER